MPQRPTAIDTLSKALELSRLPHAILLHGEDIGGLTRSLVPLLSEILKTPTPMEHPDCFVLRPSNKMRQISVENTRELIRNLQHTGLESAHKVAVVMDADRMHIGAANAFLKTLEEPPLGTVIFMLTTKPHGLLETIRSRCFQFRIPLHGDRTHDEDWQSWLSCYGRWIESIRTERKSKRNAANLVLPIYDMVMRFDGILKGLSDKAWESEKGSLPENLTDDQEIALKTSVYKNIRTKLMQEVAVKTRDMALSVLGLSRPLDGVMKELERVTGLLEVNLNESTALEHFLLNSLRAWSTA